MTVIPEELLSPKALAALMGVTCSHLQRLRTDGGGPPFLKLSTRRVAYRSGDINAWLNGRVVRTTAEAAWHRHRKQERSSQQS